MELTAKEKDTLLDIAKNAIAAKINNKDIPKLTVDSERLQEKRGAFVTVKRGHLRGCIGLDKAS